MAALLDAHIAERADAAIPGIDRLRWARKPLVRHWGDKPAEAVTEAECRAGAVLALTWDRVQDANGVLLAYVYGEARYSAGDDRLTLGEARRIAAGIARLPELLGKARGG